MQDRHYEDREMLTIETLRDEHTGILTVLEQLELAVAAAEHGASVPADVFADVQEFFAVFVQNLCAVPAPAYLVGNRAALSPDRAQPERTGGRCRGAGV
jgi:hypothetical protein